MKQIYLILLALAAAFSAAAQANFQPGYVQKTDGSVQQGLLDYRSETRLAQQLTFKPGESASEVVYEPAQLQGYGFDGGKRYETFAVAGPDSVLRPSFLEVLVKGAASLYFANQNGTERFFIRKGEQPLQELVLEKRRVQKESKTYLQEVKLYIGTLTYLFSDCKAGVPRLERTRFQQSDLIRVTAAYNACVGPVAESFTKDERRKLVVDVALTAGAGAAKASFSAATGEYPYLASGNHTASISPTVGISLDIHSYKLSEKLNLSTGFLLSAYSVEGTYTSSTSEFVYSTYDYSIKATYIKMPFMLRYVYPKGSIRPFANLGVQQGILLSSDSELTEHATIYASERTSEGVALESVRNYEFGFVGGFGATTGVSDKMKLSLEARFEKNNGLSPYRYLKQQNYVGSLLLGLIF